VWREGYELVWPGCRSCVVGLFLFLLSISSSVDKRFGFVFFKLFFLSTEAWRSFSGNLSLVGRFCILSAAKNLVNKFKRRFRDDVQSRRGEI